MIDAMMVVQAVLTKRAIAAGAAPILRRAVLVRHHMSHGSGGLDRVLAAAPVETGPRTSLRLGLDSARASQNVLRLLESCSDGGADALSAAWHPTGLRWTLGEAGWKPSSFEEGMKARGNYASAALRLEWLSFSDDRTALAKVRGVDGTWRYSSMLRLDPDSSRMRQQAMVHHANDGWCIVREVKDGSSGTEDRVSSSGSSMGSIVAALEEYLSIEHGGGSEDVAKARGLFAQGSALLSVGTAPLDEERTTWSSPAGTLLEVPLDTYLEGVESQTAHSDQAGEHNAIVQLDVMPSGGAASATVHVGNGARTSLFVDHLLLGRRDDDRWQILSKTFSPRPFPK